jgi:signal transduction histidine kinase/CheY-like chemotaxis protein
MCLRESGEIRFISDKLKHRMPDLETGRLLTEVFIIKSPAMGSAGFSGLGVQHLSSLFLLVGKERKFALRGQLTRGMHDSEHMYFFIGSPWLSWMYENVPEPVVLAKEFPVFDNQLEHNMYLVSQRMMLGDLEELSGKLKASKLQSDAANRAKTQFVRHISHELRTPLNGVVTALRLALDETEPQKKDRLLSIAASSGNTLMDLVNEVLDFSRLEEGVHVKELMEFPLRGFFKDIEAGFSALAMESAIEIVYELSADLPALIRADRKSLQKILLNLIGNALKYSRSDVIRVGACVQSRGNSLALLLIDVEDRGVGIDAAHHEAIFEPFWIASKSYSSEPSTGLGLAITKQLVTTLGGQIGLDSPAAGGCRFHFCIPVQVINAPASPPRAETPLIQNLARYEGRVLLVEDNPVNLQLGKLLIEKFGFEVLTADSGEAAVCLEQGTDLDLVFMDINLPGINGMEATQAIRSGGRNPGIPIVALTANVSSDDVASYRHSGMNDVLTKPIKLDEMHAVCDRYFRSEPVDPKGVASPVSEAEMQKPLLDVAPINALINDLGAESWTQLLSLFLRETENRMSSLLQIISASDHAQLGREAHRLASSVLAFGLLRMGARLREIERAAASGAIIPTHLDTELKALYDSSMAALKDSLES